MTVEYTTPEAVLALGETDPEYAAFKAENPVIKAPWHDPMLLRMARKPLTDAAYEKLANKGTFMKIPMRDGFSSEILVHKPLEAPSKPSPLVVLAYGGGFLMGEHRQLSPYAGAICHLYGATVVNLSYRRAPEHPFPAAQNDVWDTLLWLSDPANTKSIGADPSAGFILGGVSAGGNLSASLGQRWVDEAKTPKLTGAWLCIPYVLERSFLPPEYEDVYLAREQNKDADVLDDVAFQWIEEFQKPDFYSPLHSPFNSENDDTRHKGMPPCLFQVDGQDPLRDDGLIYERVLRKAGVQTKLHVYPGLPHAHWAMFPSLEVSKKTIVDTIKGFAWLLKLSEPTDAEVWGALSATPQSG